MKSKFTKWLLLVILISQAASGLLAREHTRAHSLNFKDAIYPSSVLYLAPPPTSVITISTAVGNLDRTVENCNATSLSNALALLPAATTDCPGGVVTRNLISDVTTYNPGGLCLGKYSRVRTWNFTDACGTTSANYVQTITGTDNTVPTFTKPTDKTIFKSATLNGLCTYNAAISATGDVTNEADGCGGTLIATAVDSVVNGTGVGTNPNCLGGTRIYRRWSLVDACGNSAATQTQIINIYDNTKPSFTKPNSSINLYRDANCNYNTNVIYAGDVTNEADNCSVGLQATYTDVDVAGNCPNSRVITRTWRLVDNCGNSATNQTQFILIGDSTRPTFTRPPNITIYTNASCVYDSSVANTGDVTNEADNCGHPGSRYTDVVTAGSCAGSYTITRTWTLEDDCHNSATAQVQTITVLDNIAPTITTTAGSLDATLQCTDASGLAAAIAAEPNATDNCSTPTRTLISDVLSNGSCQSNYTRTRTWRFTDACGNSSGTFVQVITVLDNTGPVVTTTAGSLDADFECSNTGGLAAALAAAPSATDNCSNSPIRYLLSDTTIAGSCASNYTRVRTWNFTDSCGNASANFVQTITVHDLTVPTFTMPVNTTIYTDANCSYDATTAVTGDVTDEADNCSNSINATYSDAIVDGPCLGSKVITRTWSLVDNCGNSAANQVQTITVSDNTAPTFTRPANTTIYTDANCSYDATVSNTGDVTNEADNCSTGLNATYSDETVAGPCEGSHVITRTWSLVDACGNTAANQVQTITVSDNIAPTFTKPSNLTIYTDANCNFDASISQTGDVTNEADNCSTGLTATYSDDTTAGPCEGSRIITRTWSLIDHCGNSAANQVQTITVSDNIAPTFTRPANTTIYTDASCQYDASASQTGDVTNEADNCSTGLNATYSDVITGGPCSGTHIITRTWSLVDACGNSAATQVQTITVSDNTAPTFTKPANTTIYTDANCEYDATVSATGDVTNEADNCTLELNATFTDVVVNGPCEGTHIITRTWSLTDNCGNTAENQIQTITVSDNTAPTFTRPVNTTIYTDADCNYDATVSVTGDVTNEADNCSNGLNATFSDEVTAGPCEGSHVITRTWSLVDNCGNSAANQVQTITVSDNLAPSFTRPADITIYTDLDCNYDACVAEAGDVTNEADNCSTGLQATYSDQVSDGPCVGSHTITRTWILVDDCGNSSATQVQTITVSDNVAPTFTRPSDITIYTDATCNYDASVGATGDVTNEADNCSISLNATFIDVETEGPCEGSHVITRTWSLVDNCGNSAADQIQTITVTDNTAPTFTRPANITIYTDASCNYDADVTATGDVTNEADNCTQLPNAIYSDEITNGPCEGSHIITRTWSLADNCGNTAANQIQIITVSDNTAPTFTVPGDIEIFTDASCNYDVSVTAAGEVTDELDNCTTGLAAALQATYSDVVTVGPCEGSHVITRTWSLVDDCGNSAANQVQTITITDNSNPTFTRPDDITIYTDTDCEYNASVSNTGDVTNEADNCSTELNATFSDEIAPGPCQGSHIITRTWNLVDDCGNSATEQVQTITVSDNTAPTFTRPADLTIYTDANCNYEDATTATGDVTNEADNCSTGLNATYNDVVTAGPCEGSHVITRTWSLIDNCGNTAADQVQTITVSDNTAPTFTRPSDLTIYTDADCNYDAEVSTTGDVTNEADNCSTGIQATHSDVVVDGPCQGSKVITRTWSLIDNCGNTAADQVQTITVSDNIAPTYSIPDDITIYTDANCEYDASVGQTGDVTNEHDNCSTGINATYTDSTTSGQCDGSYTIIRTWSLVDDCGNHAADMVQTILVRDTTAPTFDAPSDITIYTDGDCVYDSDVTSTGDVTNETDNCTRILNATYTDVVVNGTCEGSHIITRTWYLVDASGNSAATQVQTITVSDNTAPTFTRPADINITTNAACEYDASISVTGDVTNELDNCTTGLANPLQAAYSDEIVAGSCAGSYVISRTWSLVDDCGNSAVPQVQTIYVNDETAPTFTAPANATIYADGNCSYNAIFAGDVTDEHDNCSQNLEAVSIDSITNGDCEGSHILYRVWSLTDDCGNRTIRYQTITVLDTINPTFTVPEEATVASDETCNYDISPAFTGEVSGMLDNCSNNFTVTYTDINLDSIAETELVIRTLEYECNIGLQIVFDTIITPACEGAHVFQRNWTVVDDCGNSTTQSQRINVVDVLAPSFTAPPDITVYRDANCDYDSTTVSTGDVTDEADNCSTGLQAQHGDIVCITDDGCGGKFILRVWSLSDHCGNYAEDQIQAIYVRDSMIPTFTVPADAVVYADANCSYDVSPSVTGDVTDEHDNCSTGLNATYSDDTLAGSCAGAHVITRTWTLTDDCGNQNVQVQTINVYDNTAPIITTTAGSLDADLECSDDEGLNVAMAAQPSATDNCSTLNMHLISTNFTLGSCASNYTIVRTWNFTDDCGNTSDEFTQTITVHDLTAPTFTAPADMMVYTDANCSYDASLLITGDVTDEADNCSTGLDATYTESMVDGECDGSFIITRTWSLVDECGNQAADQIQTITIMDNIVPSFTAPAEATIYTDASCAYDADPVYTGDVTDEADNCSMSLNAIYNDDIVPGPCAGSYTITRTWNLVDNCGNYPESQVQIIHVVDNTAPTFTVPGDITIFTDANCNFDACITSTGIVSDALDNCSMDIQATYTDSIVDGSCEGSHTIYRTWSLVDDCGNHSANQLQVITVSDNTIPTFTAPSDIIIYTDANCNYDASPSAAGDVIDESDNCTVSFEATYMDEIIDGECDGSYVITRTWSLIDDCGNYAEDQIQTITVMDNIAPTFTAPAETTIYTDASCAYDADPIYAGDVTDEADNCSGGVNAFYNDVVTPGSCEGSYEITRTWTLYDNCGNQAADQIQTIHVNDNIAPTFTVPGDIEVYTDADCNYDITVESTGIVSDALDNCSTGLNAIHSDSIVNGSCTGTHMVYRTWSLVDNCGNHAENQVQVITISDRTAPTFTAPADIEIFTGGECGYDASTAATGDVSDEHDNCSIGLNATYMDDITDGPCPGTHIISRTWSLIDACGNYAGDQIQTITVTDNTAPIFTRPDDITIYTDASCNYDAGTNYTGDVTNEYDNCTQGVEATYTDVVVDGECTGSYIITRTWSLVDGCDNHAADQVQTITVSDNIAPTFTRPADTEIYTDASCNYDASASITGDVMDASDNCSGDVHAIYSDVITDGPCEGSHVITRTWSLVDNCGNTAADQIQTITVSDNTAPTFTVPGDITIYTDANCNYDADPINTGEVTDELDNCTTVLNAEYRDSIVSGQCDGNFTIIRTWYLVDNCGNHASDQIQVITVRDNIAPAFTKPADIEIYSALDCSYNADVNITGDVTNETDNCTHVLNATYSDVVNEGSCEGSHVITRTWSLVDASGNAAADQIQTITVSDITPPTFNRPDDIIISTDANCTYDDSPAATGDVSNEADNCTTGNISAFEATYHDEIAPGACSGSYVISRTWSLVDHCGNSAADQVQTIYVNDEIAPTFTAPENAVIYVDAACAYSALFAGDVTDEHDNCSNNLEATYTDSIADGDCEGSHILYRVWTLADDCGNVTLHYQTITVLDTIAPTFTVPEEFTVASDENCNYDISSSITGEVSGLLDNCSSTFNVSYSDVLADSIVVTTVTYRELEYECNLGLNIIYVDSLINGECEGSHTFHRTWVVTDDCGNTSSQLQVLHVVDVFPPTFTVPADITVYKDANCNYDTLTNVTGDVTDEADNCSTGLNAEFGDIVSIEDDGCGGRMILRVWSLNDHCGNYAEDQIQLINVRDSMIPTFTVPADIEIYTDAGCSYDASTNVTGDVSDEHDNCSTGLNATYSDEVADGACVGSHTITRTWTLTDNCGNMNVQVQTITVTDHTAPTVSTVAGSLDRNLECSDAEGLAIAMALVPEASDVCSNSTMNMVSEVATEGDCSNTQIIVRTWNFTDDCGNVSDNFVQTITIEDNTAPSFTAPATTTIYTDASCNYDAATGFTGDVTDEADNCSTGLNAVYTDSVVDGGCEGSHIIYRTWTLTDDCGNYAANQVQVINVSDNTVPTFTVPGNITIYTDANCNFDACAIATGDVTDELDNCSTGLQATFTDSIIDGNCQGTHIITRTWSLVDNCGNHAADQIQVITVNDNTNPTFTAPANVDVYTDANCVYDASPAATGDVTNEADNCSTGIEASYSDEITPGACSGTYVITRTWNLVDNCGNYPDAQVQTITVHDTIIPTFTAPANLTVYTNANCDYNASVEGPAGDVMDEHDNCTVSLNATFTDNIEDGECDGSYIITRTWSLIDNCGNMAADQIQVITVMDTTAPVYTRPADVTIYTDASCSYDADVLFTGDVLDESDNCTTSGLNAIFVDDVQDGDCEGSHVIYRTWTLYDNCGNQAGEQVQTIFVRDTTAPTFTVPGDMDIYTDGNCQFDTSVTSTGEVTDELDNCTTGTLSNFQATYSDVVTPGASENSWIVTRTWSLVDACGNSAANQVQIIHVNSAEINLTGNSVSIPDGNAITSITDHTDFGTTYPSSEPLIRTFTIENNGTTDLVVSDIQMGGVDAAYFTVGDISLPYPIPVGQSTTFTVTFIAPTNGVYNASVHVTSSDCNEADYDFAVKAEVICLPPNFTTCPTDIETYTSSEDCTTPVYYAPEVEGIPTPDFIYTLSGATTGSGAGTGSGIIFNKGVTTVTMIATNMCGADTCQFTVTVLDMTPPTFTRPEDITIYTDGSCGFDSTVVATGDVTDEADNCLPQEATYTDFVVEGNCRGSRIIVRTWSLLDGNGNAADDQYQIIYVNDTIVPVISSPDTVVYYTSAKCGINVEPNPTVTDNCDNAVTVNYQINDGNCPDCQLAGDEHIPYFFPVGYSTVTVTATDDCYNTSTFSYVVQVIDTVKPVVVAKDITLYLCADGTAILNAGMIDSILTDACGILDTTVSQWSFDCGDLGDNPVTLTGTDIHGNTSSDVAIVHVVDVTAPVVITRNITVYLDATGNVSITPAQIDSASTDPCGIASYSLSKTNFTCANIGNNTVTLYVTDNSGNVGTHLAVVTVRDNMAPNALCKPITINLVNGVASITASQVNNGSTDNCGIKSIAISKKTFNCADIGANNVTLTVTDNSNNVSTCVAVVTVNGTVPTCSITSSPNNTGPVIGSTNTYAAVNQMFYGYGAKSMNLLCTAVGSGPFSYVWTGTGLNNNYIANPVFTPTAGGNYNFTCTAINSFGCTTTCTITICVIDVTTTGGILPSPNVYLCHNGSTLSVPVTQVQTHLGVHPGDVLGACGVTCGSLKTTNVTSSIVEEDLRVYPNPSSSIFTFDLETNSDEAVSITIYDMQGQLVFEKTYTTPREMVVVGDDLANGMYIARVKQNGFDKTVKIQKIY